MTRSTRSHAALALLGLVACGPEEAPLQPELCRAGSEAPTSVGCAVITGVVRDASGRALDGIEGSVRPAVSCPCTAPRLVVDDNGTFVARLYQTRALSPGDTLRVTLVAQATHAKYPRHVTGAPYFDTLRVLLRFAPHGSAPFPTDAILRIVFPGQDVP